jgi:HEPN domain-containing protein
MKKSTIGWLMHANEDLVAMKSLYSNALLTGVVAFHAQQCVEKCFKAVLVEFTESVPRVHDLVRLHALVIVHIQLGDIDVDVLRELSDLYIDVRYPSEFGTLPTGRPDLDDALRFVDFTENLYVYLKDLLA